jgi:hypothetical protein
MKQGKTGVPVVGSTFSDHYFLALGLLLAGYAIGNKAFAYIGIPPLYIGDVALLFGLIALLRSGCAIATLATLPSLLLAVLFGWILFVCTLPYLSESGVNTLRDSVIVSYGGFSFLFAALLLEKPERLALVIPFLRIIGSAVILVVPPLVLLVMTTGEQGFLVRYMTFSAWSAHLLGAALLILLGFRRASIGWIIILFIGITMLAMRSRSSLLSFLIPFFLAIVVTGKWREAAAIVVTVTGLIGVAYLLDFSIPTGEVLAHREISARQFIGNVVSIFGVTTDVQGGLEGTRTFRLEWWKVIFDYTFNGPYFWTGKGFGINLAEADGFVVGDPYAPSLRSPHNCHLTMLGRTGVPGLALWFLTFASWEAMLFTNMVRARLAGDRVWADFFLLIFCYGLSFIIEGTFEVALEGPVSGIWFWSLFGVGVGATMIYRASLKDIETRTDRQVASHTLRTLNV